MNWHYATDGKAIGPVSQDTFDNLVRSGVIVPDTLVWHEGMKEWRPYREAVTGIPADNSSGSQAPAGASCAACGKWFLRDEMIHYEGSWVCASCKPAFFQRVREGAPFAASSGPHIGETQLLQREYRIDIGDALGRAWKIFSARPGFLIGATLLSGVAFVGLWIISTLIGMFIPFAGQFLMSLFAGPIQGGALWTYLRVTRGEDAQVSDVFTGFSRHFAQLLLVSLIEALINLACMIPFGIGLALMIIPFALQHKEPGGALFVVAVIFAVVAFILAFGIIIYLSNCWTFALLLVVDKGYRFWPAMQLSRKVVARRWWMTFAFFLVASVIMTAGAFACLVGLLVTIPLYVLMKVALYEDNFRDLAPASPS
jgi:hypothetical protein